MASLLLLAPLFAASALVLAGCADHACIQWTRQDGTCPSRFDAQKAMQTAGCNEISSVDGDGDFEDDDLCCYPVTRYPNGACAYY